MKGFLLTIVLISSLFTVKAQKIVFEDNFDSYADFSISGVGKWTLTDMDLSTTYGFSGFTFNNMGTAKSFMVFNSTETRSKQTGQVDPLIPTPDSDWTARSGDKMMVAFASDQGANNDWLISPQITLGSMGNLLKFWAKSCDTQTGDGRFKVGISSTGNAPADFTFITASPYVMNPATAQWIEYTYILDAAYNNKPVYIAINCVSDSQLGFAIDDFKITTTGTTSSETFFIEHFRLYPNPAQDVLNIMSKNGLEPKQITISDLTGRKVRSFRNKTIVNVSDLASGTYLIDIITDEGKASSKFIKK